MKNKLIGILAILLSLSPLFVVNARAQSDSATFFISPWDTLGYWEFNDTNWLSDWWYAPVSFTNLDNVASWDGNALQVDSSDPAWLQYNLVEDDGHTNLMFEQGTVRLWFQPNWDSASLGGDGPGDWGRFLDAGDYEFQFRLVESLPRSRWGQCNPLRPNQRCGHELSERPH